jgi:hypothetical protein
MSKAIALNLAPHGHPLQRYLLTFIDTPMTKPFFEEATFKAMVLRKIKLGGIGKVGTCADPFRQRGRA